MAVEIVFDPAFAVEFEPGEISVSWRKTGRVTFDASDVVWTSARNPIADEERTNDEPET